MSIYDVLQSTGLPCAYSHFRTAQKPPYLVYIGDGQNNFSADNTFYYSRNEYQIEYYFTEKDEATEATIEGCLLRAGYQYEKSEDAYLSDLGLFVIYYYI